MAKVTPIRLEADPFRGLIAPASLKLKEELIAGTAVTPSFPGFNRPGLIEAYNYWNYCFCTSAFPGFNRPGLIEAGTVHWRCCARSHSFRGLIAPASLKRKTNDAIEYAADHAFRGLIAPASLKRGSPQNI